VVSNDEAVRITKKYILNCADRIVVELATRARDGRSIIDDATKDWVVDQLGSLVVHVYALKVR
jgi:ribosomal silencing factor RsfS